MKSIPMLISVTRRLLMLVVTLLIAVACSKADNLKLWQGTYKTSTTWGAMEMTTTGEGSKQEARVRFTLDGRPADSEISQLKLSTTVRLLDSRFRGGINLDGNESGNGFQPVAGGDSGKQPFMWLQKQMQRPTDRELQQMGITEAKFNELNEEGDRMVRNIGGGGLRVTIARLGIGHMDFSDNPFWDVSAAPDVRAGKLRTLAITRGYVLAFFDGCLRGQWGSLRRLVTEAGKTYPELSARSFGAMWPQ